MDLEAGPVLGRPVGGVGVLWKKELSPSIRLWQPVECEAIGLYVGSGDTGCLLVGAYFKPDYATLDSLVEYEYNLHSLGSSLTVCDANNILCAGDFNADAQKKPRFYDSYSDFTDTFNLIRADESALSKDSFTYLSSAHNTVSWLDHCLVSPALLSQVDSIRVDYNISESDHMPIIISLSGLHTPTCIPPPTVLFPSPRIDWDHLKKDELQLYSDLTSQLCSVLGATPMCLKSGCRDPYHILSIDAFCRRFTDGLITAAKECFGSIACPSGKPYQIPGWNALVKKKHHEARIAFLAWRSAGSPRTGTIFDDMIDTRRAFKLSLKQCKRHSETHRLDGLARSLLSHSPVDFWREVKKSSTASPRPTTIDGVCGDKAISQMWGKKFAALFSCGNESSRQTAPAVAAPEAEFSFTAALCLEASSQLNISAAPGPDGLSAHYFRHCSSDVFPLLANFFNCMLAHSHLPGAVVDTHMIPIPKGHLPDLLNSDSYRGIASATTISKILEASISTAFHAQLSTSPLQFGFKSSHDTESAVFLLKEVIDSYISLGSPVYASFLDLHKAFDSVDHTLLLQRLIDVNLPPNIVDLLSSWFNTQRMCVKWGGHLSDWFSVRRGVRQGGCLSPALFNIFLDVAVRSVSNLPYGCLLGGFRVNVIAYADDLVLIAPSINGLQRLFNHCQLALNDLHLQLNLKKSVCVAFKPKPSDRVIWDDLPLASISSGTNHLLWMPSFQYLGVILSDDGRCDYDLTRARRSFFSCFNILLRRFGGCSLPVKRVLFSSYCYSFYGCALWSLPSARALDLLRVGVHSAAKRLLGGNKFSCTRLACLELDVLPVEYVCLGRKVMLLKRLLSSNNPVLSYAISGPRWSSSSFLKTSLKYLGVSPR